MYDLHTHTCHSFDAEHPPVEMLAAAERAGLREICFTDHVDFDGSGEFPADLAALRRDIDALRKTASPVRVRFGAEVSLSGEACARRAREHLLGQPLDFIIGSVHMLDGIDPYFQQELYTSAPKETVYRRYLECVNRSIRSGFDFCVLGHYDYIAKFAPYADRSFSLSVAPGLFDEIFDFLIAHGKGLEINTASWKDSPAWGLDILCRYRERGGTFVTVGSDAHAPERVGHRIEEAIELARAAEIPFLAVFEQQRPCLIPCARVSAPPF